MSRKIFVLLAAILAFPVIVSAQGAAEKIGSMHSVLTDLYKEMMPLCGNLVSIGQGIAGFGALFYIGNRVWKHLSNAEPIDFYPLFRPFVIGFCIAFFPMIMNVINGIMEPTVTGTAKLVEDSEKAVAVLLQRKKEAIKDSPVWQMYVGTNDEGNRDAWYRYSHDGQDPEKERWYETIGNNVRFALAKMSYKLKSQVKEWMSEVLKVLFQAASLCINTLRTFQMVVLSILGPLAFGLAVFDGLQQTLTSWLTRFLNVYLWLPVANIFGAIISKIQEKMIELDLDQIKETGDTFFSASDTGYLIFMIIGIVGYFTVPSVANFIVNAGGGGGMLQKVTTIATKVPSAIGKGTDNMANMRNNYGEGRSGQNSGSGVMGALGRSMGYGSAYMKNKLKGGK